MANAFATQFIAQRKATARRPCRAPGPWCKKQLAGITGPSAPPTVGRALQQRLEQLDIDPAAADRRVRLSQPATVPTASFSPQPLRNGVLAVVVGLVLGVGLAFLFDFLDRRIKDEERMEREFGVPVLASVPLIDTKQASAERPTRPRGR